MADEYFGEQSEQQWPQSKVLLSRERERAFGTVRVVASNGAVKRRTASLSDGRIVERTRAKEQ